MAFIQRKKILRSDKHSPGSYSLSSTSLFDKIIMKILNKPLFTSSLLLAAVLLLCMVTGKEFLSQRIQEKIYPSEGLSQKKSLSWYFSDLDNTAGMILIKIV